jgi:anti-sigma factor RsiW
MMCLEKDEILLDYCAGTLEPARAAEVREHIEGCADCRRLVEAQRDVWSALDRWTAVEVSPDFDARLYARIAREQAKPAWIEWLRPLWKPALPLAVACAVLVVGFLVRTPRAVDNSPQVRADKIDIEQVEKTLEDLDMLTPSSKL